MFVSNVCRLSKNEVEAISPFIHDAGKTEIPFDVLKPRQIVINKQPDLIGSIELKRYRGNMIPVIPRPCAERMIVNGLATWSPQWALVFTIDACLNDKDVLNDKVEYERVLQAKNNGKTLALIAIIGENRSPLAVCRNIVSGCQDIRYLIDDAKGAMDSADVFLVED